MATIVVVAAATGATMATAGGAWATRGSPEQARHKATASATGGRTTQANLGSHTIVSGPIVTLPGGGYLPASATCPTGSVVLGGGESNTSWGEVVLTDSQPTANNGWLVYALNNGTSDETVIPYAVCGT